MPPGTPLKNSILEWEFATLYSWMHTMKSHMGLDERFKTGICPEYEAFVTKLENIIMKMYKDKCDCEKFYRSMPDYRN